MNELIDPKEIEINGYTFTISKFDAVAGREIVAVYTSSGLPKIGDYKTNEAIMFKLMGFVAVTTEAGKLIRLSTPELVRNHVKDWETLTRLELKTIEYNCSFFQDGGIWGFLSGITQMLPEKIIETLTTFSRSLSQKEKPRSTS